MERAYTVSEIESMRESLRAICTPMGVPYYQEEVDKNIESQLQTYLRAGVTPADLGERANEVMKQQQERQIQLQQFYAKQKQKEVL